MSRSVLRQRALAIIAAFAMVMVVCGFTAQGFSTHATGSDHTDWSMHFTGMAGSAPKPVPVARPVLASWLAPPSARTAARCPRRPRAHLPRGPPVRLPPASFAA